MRYKGYPKRLLEWWVKSVQRYSLMVIIITGLITGGVLFYSIRNFKINVDINSMISEKLFFRKLEDDFAKAFPKLTDTIVVVLDADTVELAISARKSMAERLKKEAEIFKTVYEPGGGDFFEKNGLLFLSVDEVEEFADKLAEVQPFLGILSKDLSLRGIFSIIEKALNQTEDIGLQDRRINILFDRISQTFESITRNHPYRLSWQGIIFGEDETAEQRRQFIILQPYLDLTKLSAGEVPLKTVHRIVKELQLNEANGVKVRITGDVALSFENLMTVRNSIGIASLVSLLLVGITLYIGLGCSFRLVFVSLLTLITGLIWTTGFAIAFIGSLNLISITFAVLFIGLGIDYSIHFCLRYRELIESGYRNWDSIITTAKGVGGSLFLCSTTTAIGFYAFVPTAYAGVSELGLISGTGMFISFFLNLTVLPALLTLIPIKGEKIAPLSLWEKLLTLPYTYHRAIIVGAIILGLGAVMMLPRVSFDYNPLNLYDQTSESVSTVKDLFKDSETSPWTTSILIKDAEEAKVIAERLGDLEEVKRVITLFDFVPEDQTEKLNIISDIALFMPQNLSDIQIKQLNYKQNIEALRSFEMALKKSLLLSSEADGTSAKRLYESIQQFKTLLGDSSRGNSAFIELERSMLYNLPALLDRLRNLLQATTFNESDLPQELVNRYISVDGRYRIQVFPSENIIDADALKRFVDAVRTIAPNATDSPVTIYESGRAVVSSLRQAILSALVVIIIFLFIELKSLSATVLILIPLMLAALLTASASVLLGIPLNFANVIVMPLLLGYGVDSGIHFIHRYRTEPPENENMLKTSTARAVLFSALTTIMSFSSLSFLSHRGISSMGKLLTICIGLQIICTLVLLPALLKLSKVAVKTK